MKSRTRFGLSCLGELMIRVRQGSVMGRLVSADHLTMLCAGGMYPLADDATGGVLPGMSNRLGRRWRRSVTHGLQKTAPEGIAHYPWSV